jgi:hypothetical protein
VRGFSAVAVALAVVCVVAGPGAAGRRDDTGWLQAKLDQGGRIVLPKLSGGRCYAARGLWVSHDDTDIVSQGACIVALGPGPVRLRSADGDPIPANAVFFVNHSRPLAPAPARIRISGLRIVVPETAQMFGLGIFGHDVTVSHVTVTGAPIDDITIGGRANGDGYAGRVSIQHSYFAGGTRNVLSATGVVDLTIEQSRLTGATDTFREGRGRLGGNPAAGIDVEPDGRGRPILDVRIDHCTIDRNAGPGILLALSTNDGLPVVADRITIADNRIVDNGQKTTPPQQGGIVFNGGQARPRGVAVVERNVITGNRGAGLQGAQMALGLIARGNDLSGNAGGPSSGIRFGGERRVSSARPAAAILPRSTVVTRAALASLGRSLVTLATLFTRAAVAPGSPLAVLLVPFHAATLLLSRPDG